MSSPPSHQKKKWIHIRLVSVLVLGPPRPDVLQCTVDTPGVLVTLTLTSTTTVGVVDGVHGRTTDVRSTTEPAVSTGLTELSELVLFAGRTEKKSNQLWSRVSRERNLLANHTDGGDTSRVQLSHFTTLQFDQHETHFGHPVTLLIKATAHCENIGTTDGSTVAALVRDNLAKSTR